MRGLEWRIALGAVIAASGLIVASGRGGDLLDDIALAAAPGAAANGMVSGLGGPEAESVVVFAGENQPTQSNVVRNGSNRIGIEIRWIEQGLTFVAVTPFFVGESVHGEMDEAAIFEFVPLELAGGRDGAERGWRVDGICAETEQEGGNRQ